MKHSNVLKMQELLNDSNELLIVLEYLPENVKRVMKKRYAVELNVLSSRKCSHLYGVSDIVSDIKHYKPYS